MLPDPPALTEAGLRARLRRAATPPATGPASPEGIPAAVLVPVVLGPSPSVMLTQRTATLARHAGQVSFPGGRIDPGDPSPEHAALRETEEELGIPRASVEVMGRLADCVTGTGFHIVPVLGLLPPGLALTPAPAEVASVFHLPLSVLLDPDAVMRRRIGALEHWVWPHDQYEIWGATASILVQLADLLRRPG